ncbi:MAG: Molybdenum import ATP-binding protein ModC [Pseudomonadota bacterium]|jgi:molybdate transport system ATP-binding protein
MQSRAIRARFAGKLGAFELDATFDAPARGVTALFGPSGCGKTTILRCIAGLEKLPGRLTVGDEVWQDTDLGVFLPPHKRHLGYVFQEASLFPHLSVRDNLLFGARRALQLAKGEEPEAFDRIVSLLGIAHLLGRSPDKLSGGERQRVAVGRALLSQPRVLLMDEPLSALDRMTKDEILPYFETLHTELDIPILYVSHDISEIERLADQLVILDKGRALASGPLQQLQTDPRLPLIKTPQAAVVLEGEIIEIDSTFALTSVAIAGGTLLVPGSHGDKGERCRLRIFASDVSIALAPPSATTILNCLNARIEAIEGTQDNPQVTVLLRLGKSANGSPIAARITRKSLSTLGLEVGQSVYAQIKGVALVR